jgi:hypothetical protein
MNLSHLITWVVIWQTFCIAIFANIVVGYGMWMNLISRVHIGQQIAKRNNHITFFDSYGKTPEFFKRTYWIAYFQQKLKCKVSYYSQMQRQSYISRTCGAWCLMFLWEFWSRDKNVLRTLNNGANLLKNEQQLQTFVYEHFPGIKKIYEKKCRKCKGQMCKTFLDMYADRL